MQTFVAFPRVLLSGFALVCVSAVPLFAGPTTAAAHVAMVIETEKEAFDAAMAAVKAVAALQTKVDAATREVERCKRECDAAERASVAAGAAWRAAIEDHASVSVTEAAQRSAESALKSFKLAMDRESKAIDRYTGLCLDLSAAAETMKRTGDAWIAKSKQGR